MRIVIDTNVILDIFLKREPFFDDSYSAIRKATEKNTECYISSSAVTDIFYILRKAMQSSEKARTILNDLMQLVTFSDVLVSDIMDALVSDMPDFEDAVVNAVARRINASYILTRNTKDYAKADVLVVSPKEYLKL